MGITTIPFSYESCKTSRTQITERVSYIMVSSSIPTVDIHNKKIVVLVDSFYVYNYENYVLYRIPETYVYTNTTTDTNGNVINRKILRSEIKSHYWAFKAGDSTGLRFDSLGSNVGTKFNIDSLIDEKTSFKQGISMESYRLFDKITDSADHFFMEKYVPKVKDKTTPDSSFLYFRDDWDDVNFSFAKDLDLQKKSKLYKFRIVFNPIPKGEYPFDVPRRELIFEIRKPELKNSEQILELFKKVKDQQALNK